MPIKDLCSILQSLTTSLINNLKNCFPKRGLCHTICLQVLCNYDKVGKRLELDVTVTAVIK